MYQHLPRGINARSRLADLIAVRGSPPEDVHALERVTLVMKGGGGVEGVGVLDRGRIRVVRRPQRARCPSGVAPHMPAIFEPPRRLSTSTLRFAAAELAGRDPDLAMILWRLGLPPLWSRRAGFTTLVRIILEQQVSLASARTMYHRLREHVGPITPESVAVCGVATLRALGFTRQKAAYCHGLAEAIRCGSLDLEAIARQPDSVGRRRLMGVRGLGPWSVDIYYLMALRRPDVWPRGDHALVTAVQRVKRLQNRPNQDKLARIAERWAPWRSVAARILWHHYLAIGKAGRREQAGT